MLGSVLKLPHGDQKLTICFHRLINKDGSTWLCIATYVAMFVQLGVTIVGEYLEIKG